MPNAIIKGGTRSAWRIVRHAEAEAFECCGVLLPRFYAHCPKCRTTRPR